MQVNNLNSIYTFDNFIIENNKFAYEIALKVANNLADVFNPLYIFGENGQVKTHLMQAIGNKVLQDNPDIKICYIRTDELVEEIIDSKEELSKNNGSLFNKLNNIDVLLVDDIQLMADKEECQEVFKDIFNKLFYNKKQIIITGDKYPIYLDGVKKNLQTRFCWGNQVHIL